LERFPYYKKYKGRIPEGIKLNLGCWNTQFKDFINVDKYDIGQELIYNLEKFPYPFKDNSVSFILISHYIEHHPNILTFMKELNRICKNGAVIDILVPYWTSENANCELDHKEKFGWNTFMWTKHEKHEWNIGINWEIISKRIHYNKTCRWCMRSFLLIF